MVEIGGGDDEVGVWLWRLVVGVKMVMVVMLVVKGGDGEDNGD